jgi:tetratricopeptide (TPR) repeat protein
MSDDLRALWDFDDLAATEGRLRARLSEARSGAGRAEITAELARVHGLRGEFEEGDSLLDEASRLSNGTRSADARIALERGRLRRSSGDPESARPLFEFAYAAALDTELWFLAADAAHMVALVAGAREGFVDWTQRGIELAERHEETAYWLGPLLNNLGWEYFEAGDFEPALDAFQRALRVRERDPANGDGLSLARYAVGKALRSLDRSDDAIPLVEEAVAWADAQGAPDGWFHEELAAEYDAVGRVEDAAEQARLAIPLLERDDPSFADDDGRRARLQRLAR